MHFDAAYESLMEIEHVSLWNNATKHKLWPTTSQHVFFVAVGTIVDVRELDGVRPMGNDIIQ